MSILKYLKESLINENNICSLELRTYVNKELYLYHGSSKSTPIKEFRNNLFATEGDTVASNYAENNGGLLYLLKVQNIKALDFTVENCKYSSSGFRVAGTDDELNSLLLHIFGNNGSEIYRRLGVRVFSKIFNHSYETPNEGIEKVIDFAKTNGYNAIRFNDESFDTMSGDITYVIFDSSSIDIISYVDTDSDEYMDWLTAMSKFTYNK